MQSREIRQKFFDFFMKNGHTQVSSSSLIPAQDPTLLFTNAGMNQFKDVFLGYEKRNYTRAVTIQKCIRAGGKHNDLENVGFTARHLTFFEMMGNFSFGDYFKKEAIRFAWDFLTKEIGLPTEKLYASVYQKDNEAYDIWHTEIGLPTERIVRLGEKDNFWQMGENGPCGPCTEIYIDREKYGCGLPTCAPGCSCDRFLEIWNNVFMQFDRQNGIDTPLKQTGVDTGMGLERLAVVVQGVESVYHTDLFIPLINAIEKIAGISYAQSPTHLQAAFHVIADHLRSTSFAIADGCLPSNEGRGYVLRKIIRRAALFAQKLHNVHLFPKVVPALVELMGPLYPELKTQEKLIIQILTSEVEKFTHNLVNGQSILAEIFAKNAEKIVTGAQAFKLYDTYGFPLELTKVIAQEHDYTVDENGFEKEMEKQRLQSGKKIVYGDTIHLPEDIITEFTGYTELTTTSAIIHLLVDQHVPATDVKRGERCFIITERSPFYVECGGQVSDQGSIEINGFSAQLLSLKKIHQAIAAEIEAPIDLHLGDMVTLRVNEEARINTMKNHTATHLLQAALMKILGKQVKQSGSLVVPDYLRFDFTYDNAVTLEQMMRIEDEVNKQIRANIPLSINNTTYKDATSRGVIAFFGEKYNPENVRVVEVPGISAELCGGTHVRATGDIGIFKITELSALSAGNKRIVALTGPKALELFQDQSIVTKELSQEFKVQLPELVTAVLKQKELLKKTQADLKTLKKQLIKTQIPTWIEKIHHYGHIPFLMLTLKNTQPDELKDIATELTQTKPALYIILTSPNEMSPGIVALSSSLTGKINMKDFTLWLRSEGFKGGGSDTMMQGTFTTSGLEQKTHTWLEKNSK